MTPERWRQIERLYDAALERAAGERAAFLDTACRGDAGLRRDIQLLLAGHEEAGGFLDSPAWEVAAGAHAPDRPEAVVGRSIDRYQILSSLGSGGIGERRSPWRMPRVSFTVTSNLKTSWCATTAT